jgi:hypothetical protein
VRSAAKLLDLALGEKMVDVFDLQEFVKVLLPEGLIGP